MSRLMLEGVCAGYGSRQVLHGISAQIEPGELVVLVGANASGKTTLVNAISGQVSISEGHIHCGQRKLSGLSARQIALAGISRTFQIVRLFAGMTVLENVETGALAQGCSLREACARAKALLDDFGLGDKAEESAATLSYGDQRRVEMARALAAAPCFLLLDEPAAGMNDAESETLRQLLAALPQQYGLGLLIIDHDMGLMMRLCQRLHVLAAGRTLAEGDAAYIRQHPAVIEAYLGSTTHA